MSSAKPLSAVEFAEAVITHWPPFRWEEHQEVSWTQAIVRELSGFDRQVLGNAMAHLVRTRRDSKTPTVALCIDACVAARRWLDAEKQASALPIEKSPERMRWEDRQRLANDLVKTAPGRQAAQEGWIASMHAFAVEHGRLPSGREIDACKRYAKEFDEAFNQCVATAVDETKQMAVRNVSAQLVKLGEDMIARRKKLADMVLGVR